MPIAHLGIEADTSGVDKAVPSLDRIAAAFREAHAAADGLEKETHQVGAAARAAAPALDAEAAAARRAAIAARALEQAQAAEARASRVGSMQRANLIFQLQDIGVSLASGMPLWMVAVQQGSQMSMIYGSLGKLLSETFKTLVMLPLRFFPLTAAIGFVGTAIAEMTNEFNKTSDVTIEWGDTALAVFQVIGQGLMDWVKPAVDAVAPWFIDAWEWVKQATIDAGNAIVRDVVGWTDFIVTAFLSIPDAVVVGIEGAANMVIGGVEEMIQEIIASINGLIANANGLAARMGVPLNMSNLGRPDDFKLGRVDIGGAAAQASLDKRVSAYNNRLKENYDTDYMAQFGDAVGSQAEKNARKRIAESDAGKKAAKEAERLAEAYEKIVRGAKDAIKASEMEARALGMSAEAASRMRHEEELLNKARDAGITLTNAQRTELIGLAEDMAAAEERTRQLTELYTTGKEIFGGFFSDFKNDLKDTGDFFGSLASAAENALDRMLDKALQVAADAVWDQLFSSIMGGMGGGGGSGGGNWLGDIFGSLFKKSANGNVFDRGVSGYSNSVVSSPTIFPFANGIGLMGEAGPEAIMPLARGPDGKLGVRGANDNGSTVVNVSIIRVPGEGQDRVESEKKSDGSVDIKAFIVETVTEAASKRGSPLNRLMANGVNGLTRRG